MGEELQTHLIAIPILDQLVLADTPEIVSALLVLHLRDSIVMCEERAVTVTKI